MKLLKTGIAGFDEFLLGGLPSKILLLTGSPGSGNEVFARQIIYSRAKQNPITYFIINNSPESIREDMIAYGWDIKCLEENGNWKFKTITNTTNLTNEILEEMKQQRATVIDSLSELFLTRKTKDIVSLITAMTQQNKQTPEVQLLLLTDGMQDQVTETTIQHYVEGVISFTTTWTSDTTLRHVIIKKMTGILIPTRRLPYNITKKGITIETATRIT
jgi:archaeal flagellar protein FlaH